MSLWNVNDAATALLMGKFYELLEKGQEKAAALHRAKRWLRQLTMKDKDRLLERHPELARLPRGVALESTERSEKGKQKNPFAHPHYWAGFVLTGAPN